MYGLLGRWATEARVDVAGEVLRDRVAAVGSAIGQGWPEAADELGLRYLLAGPADTRSIADRLTEPLRRGTGSLFLAVGRTTRRAARTRRSQCERRRDHDDGGHLDRRAALASRHPQQSARSRGARRQRMDLGRRRWPPALHPLILRPVSGGPLRARSSRRPSGLRADCCTNMQDLRDVRTSRAHSGAPRRSGTALERSKV